MILREILYVHQAVSFIPQGLDTVAQGKKIRASARIYATLGLDGEWKVVREASFVYPRNIGEDEMNTAYSGLGNIPVRLSDCRSADELIWKTDLGGGKVRGTHFALPRATVFNHFVISEPSKQVGTIDGMTIDRVGATIFSD